jgi:hypothetical protein
MNANFALHFGTHPCATPLYCGLLCESRDIRVLTSDFHTLAERFGNTKVHVHTEMQVSAVPLEAGGLLPMWGILLNK